MRLHSPGIVSREMNGESTGEYSNNNNNKVDKGNDTLFLYIFLQFCKSDFLCLYLIIINSG